MTAWRAGHKINLEQLAKSLGLAKGTVSRALNGYGDIAEETRRRVSKAAAEAGYVPSTVARRLARGSKETIGYLMPAGSAHIFDPFFGVFLDALGIALGSHDLDLLLTVTPDPRQELAAYERIVRAGKVDGMVLTRMRSADPRVDYLKDTGIPFVTFGRTRNSSDFAWLDIDNEGAFRTAVGHLAGLGHERIALAGGPAGMHFTVERRRGFLQGLAEAGLKRHAGMIVEAGLTEAGGYRSGQSLLALAPRPTAIACVNDAVAIGVIRAVREAGLTVGREVSVIGYDGTALGACTDPALTSFAPPFAEACERLVEMLVAVIGGGDPTAHQELWDARLIRRASDGPPV